MTHTLQRRTPLRLASSWVREKALFGFSTPHSTHPTLSSRYVPAKQNSHCVAPALDVVPVGQAVQLDAPASKE